MPIKNYQHISHKKSNVARTVVENEFYGLTPTVNNTDSGTNVSPVKLNLAKRPAANNIIEGELAINYLKGHELIAIKNTSNEIVSFVNENEFNEAQEIIAEGLGAEQNARVKAVSEESTARMAADAEEKAKREEADNVLDYVSGYAIAELETKRQIEAEKTEELANSVDELKDDVNTLDRVSSFAFYDLNEKTETLNTSISNLTQDIETLERISSLGFADLNAKINTLLEEIADLKARINQN